MVSPKTSIDETLIENGGEEVKMNGDVEHSKSTSQNTWHW